MNDGLGANGFIVDLQSTDQMAVIGGEYVQIAFKVTDHQSVADQGRHRQPTLMQGILFPEVAATAEIKLPDIAFRIADEERPSTSRQAVTGVDRGLSPLDVTIC